jgi:hypothetical protein
MNGVEKGEGPHPFKIFDNRSFHSRVAPVDAGGVRAEWVLSPEADPARRTLYIHGAPSAWAARAATAR